MKVRVVVIGGNGFVGRHLCQTLATSGIEVINFSSGTENGIALDSGLFSKQLTLPSQVHAVYYLAQSPRYHQVPEQSVHLMSVNCVAAVQVAEAARHAGVKRFIYASTGNVYHPSFKPINEAASLRRDNWYSLSKIMAEEALALYRSDLDVTIARIFGVYGPQQTNKLVPMIADRIRSGQNVYVDKNPQDANDKDGLTVSLIYIDDLIHALISLMDIDCCPIINLAGLEAVSIRTLATELAHCMGTSVSIQMKENARSFNLLADIQLQLSLVGRPVVSLREGIERLCHE